MVEQKKNCNIARYMVLDKLETNDNRENHTQTLCKMQKEIRETDRKREAYRRIEGGPT